MAQNKNYIQNVEAKLRTAKKFIQVELDKAEQRVEQLNILLNDLDSVELPEVEDNF